MASASVCTQFVDNCRYSNLGKRTVQIIWRQRLVASVGRREKSEMDVFRICLLITHIAGQSGKSSSYMQESLIVDKTAVIHRTIQI